MNSSAELEFIIESCRCGFQGPTQLSPSHDLEWSRFIELAKFHRIEGLVHQALRGNDAVPRFVCEALAAAAVASAARNLKGAFESQSLKAAFEGASVPLIFVKGLTLGSLAYGNPALKSAIDVDLLIDQADLAQSALCLREAGFDPIAPRGSLDRWHRSWKESVWRSRRSAIQLDLHTRLADNSGLIPTINVHSPIQMVDVGSGITLPTLANDELLTYLAVHGASAGWFRLKWIADFTALLSKQPEHDVERFYDRSQTLGGARAVGQALLLADTLFGVLGTHLELSRKLSADPATCRLVRIALAMISRAPSEPTERFLGTMPIHLSQLIIKPGVAFKAAEVRRQSHQLLTRLTI